MAKLTAALVLCDVVSHGLKAGQIVEADAETIKALAKEGNVDSAKAAVDYARSEGAAVARISNEAIAGA